jgi:hypothetical protein
LTGATLPRICASQRLRLNDVVHNVTILSSDLEHDPARPEAPNTSRDSVAVALVTARGPVSDAYKVRGTAKTVCEVS